MDWLLGNPITTKPATSYPIARSSAFLRYSLYYIDVLTSKHRVSGCAAIRVNHKLLISHDYAHHPFYKVLIKEAKQQGYAVVELSSLTTLRSVLSGNNIPSLRSWEYAIRSITTKALRRGKVAAPHLRELQRIRDIIPTGTLPLIAEARITNAFKYEGSMSHVIVRKIDPAHVFETFFPNAEDAMAAFLSTKDTVHLKILEF